MLAPVGREVDEMWTAVVPLVFFFAVPPTGKCQGGVISYSLLQLCSKMHSLADYDISRSIEHAVLKAPQSATAPLGTNATFNCTVQHALELKWRINNLDIPLNEENMWEIAARPNNGYYRGDFWSNSTIITASLLVLASVSNNRSVNIGCAAFGGYAHPLETSPNVQLTVFGKLPFVSTILT